MGLGPTKKVVEPVNEPTQGFSGVKLLESLLAIAAGMWIASYLSQVTL